MPEWTSAVSRPLVARLAPLALAVALAAGCGGEDPDSQVTEIRTLSNDADLISGGDVLVHAELGPNVDPDSITVETESGREVTDAFAVREDGRFVGMVRGLDTGRTRLRAYGRGGPDSGETLVVTNHPSSGPIFSGPQLEPWICAEPNPQPTQITDPDTGRTATVTPLASGLNDSPDENCQAPAVIEYFFQPVSAPADCRFADDPREQNNNSCFEPFDPDNPPADDQIAEFTNDRGDTVAAIIAVERGTIDRGMYELVVFHDPRKPHHPAEPQKGWNGKLLFNFGGAAGGSRFQEPPNSPFFNERALRRGYMLATSSLNDNVNNYNHALAAEALMMLKEHIVETWGEIRFTIGSGSSGGAIQQFTMASSYPGLLDGLIPGLSFGDSTTTSLEVGDCGLLVENLFPLAEVNLTQKEKNAISGITSENPKGRSQCELWTQLFLPTGDPTNASTCGKDGDDEDFPQALVFDPQNNPEGIICDVPTHNQILTGTITTANGVERSPLPFSDVGIQYGLKALQKGVISPAEFVQVNELIGHYDINQNWVKGPERETDVADKAEGLLENYYRSGMVSNGKELDRVPIVELRANLGGLDDSSLLDFHANWRAMMIRSRLDKANGHHANHVILGEDADFVSQEVRNMAFDLMDEWLTRIEADIENGAADRDRIERNERRDADRSGIREVLPELVLDNKPADAVDRCFVNGQDVGLGTDACPIDFGLSPHQVAGGPRPEDKLVCQLEPLDFSSSDYDKVSFTQQQRDTLRGVFPDGVCDWSEPSVGQQMPLVWPTFENGPGGEALGPAPRSF